MTPVEVYNRLEQLLSAHGVFVTPGIFSDMSIDYTTGELFAVATRAPDRGETLHVSYQAVFE